MLRLSLDYRCLDFKRYIQRFEVFWGVKLICFSKICIVFGFYRADQAVRVQVWVISSTIFFGRKSWCASLCCELMFHRQAKTCCTCHSFSHSQTILLWSRLKLKPSCHFLIHTVCTHTERIDKSRLVNHYIYMQMSDDSRILYTNLFYSLGVLKLKQFHWHTFVQFVHSLKAKHVHCIPLYVYCLVYIILKYIVLYIYLLFLYHTICIYIYTWVIIGVSIPLTQKHPTASSLGPITSRKTDLSLNVKSWGTRVSGALRAVVGDFFRGRRSLLPVGFNTWN